VARRLRAGARAEVDADRRVVEEPRERVGERDRITGRDEERGVVDQLGIAAGCARDRRRLHGERFQDRSGHGSGVSDGATKTSAAAKSSRTSPGVVAPSRRTVAVPAAACVRSA